MSVNESITYSNAVYLDSDICIYYISNITLV